MTKIENPNEGYNPEQFLTECPVCNSPVDEPVEQQTVTDQRRKEGDACIDVELLCVTCGAAWSVEFRPSSHTIYAYGRT